MAVTFSPSFKSYTLWALTNTSASRLTLKYLVPYNGTQPADPSAAASGSPVFSAFSNGINLDTYWSQVGSGVSQLSVARSASASSNVSSLTFARLFENGGTALVDADIGLTTASAIVVPSLASTTGVQFVVSGLALKLASSLGTLKLNQPLANRLVEWWTAPIASPPTAPGIGANPGSAASIIKFYSGTAPATAEDPITGSELATITLGTTNIFGTPTAGSVALTTTPSVTASGTGTATHLRWTKTQGAFTFVLQGSVGTAGSGADFIVNTTSLTPSTTLTLTDATMTM